LTMCMPYFIVNSTIEVLKNTDSKRISNPNFKSNSYQKENKIY